VVQSLLVVLGLSALFALALATKSIIDFSHTGPAIRHEVHAHFQSYVLLSFARLSFWVFVIGAFFGLIGALAYACLTVLLGWRWHPVHAGLSATGVFLLVVFVQFSHQLLHLPAGITASFLYRVSRLYPLWELLSPGRVLAMQVFLAATGLLLAGACGFKLARRHAWSSLAGLAAATASIVGILLWAAWEPEPLPLTRAGTHERPNLLFIGSDTLRADRLGGNGYPRDLTPFIDALAARGTAFENNYVPLARTAPSLMSLLTGTWPHHHGVRSNYTADGDTRVDVPALPALLRDAGYSTAAVSDWCGGDLGKFTLGFERTVLPQDQWNLKYLLRQGPKDLRLFLGLFTHNRFGRTALPEIHYLGGVPMDREVGHQTRQMIRELGAGERPFMLFAFMSSTHPPFGTTYPYYNLYADPDYRGESLFAMSGLVSISSIIESQKLGIEDVDYNQIIDLYDGGVRSFDDEVARIVGYLEASGLGESTIVVIFSDHGTELFDGSTWGQGNSVEGDDPSARAPLIIVDPRRRGGVRVERITRSIDLMPTLLDLLGLPVPAEAEGTSLVPYMDGTAQDLGLTAFSETGLWIAGSMRGMQPNHLRYPPLPEVLEVKDKSTGTLSIKPEYRAVIDRARDRMVRTEDWKLVYQPLVDGAVYQLYDLRHDPLARHDVAARYPEVLERMKRKLWRWMEGGAG
jgi:arylsulfatase A-like enzyme